MTTAPWARGRKSLDYGGFPVWAPGTALRVDKSLFLLDFAGFLDFDGLELGGLRVIILYGYSSF